MDKNEVLKILETAKDKNGEVPMRLVRQAFEKLPEPYEDMISRQEAIDELESYGEFIAINIIKELPTAQPEKRWIPCSERLPEKACGCLVTVWDTEPMTMAEFPNILPYFVGWDGEQWNDADGEQCPFEIIAWMPLPEPYKEKDNERT